MKLFDLFRKKVQPIKIEASRYEFTDVTLHITRDVVDDNVSVRMRGIDGMDVCLASFITNGVSYAAVKYNEYKHGGKDEDMEPVKAEPKLRRVSYRPTPREIAEMEAWAKEVIDKEGGKR